MPKASPEDESSPPDQEEMSGVKQRLGQLEGQVENLSQRVAGLEEQDRELPPKTPASTSPHQSKKELKFNLRNVDEDSVSMEEEEEEKYKVLSRGSTGASVFETAPTDPTRLGERQRSGTISVERNEKSKLSMDSGGMSSAVSEYWDNNATGSRGVGSTGMSYRTFNSRKTQEEEALERRYTVLRQVEYARQVSLPLRILGIILAFLTIIFLWETIDTLAHMLFSAKEKQLIFYLGVSAAAAFTLALSHHWIKVTLEKFHRVDTKDDPTASSLVPSFAYALSTLFLAVGTWGIMKTVVEIMVPEKKRLFCYGCCGLFTLICTVIYALLTRHNVLLDIASCATSLGLYDVDDVDGSMANA